MKPSVFGLHRPRVVAFHHHDKNVRRLLGRAAGRHPLQAIIQRRCVLCIWIKRSRGAANIAGRFLIGTTVHYGSADFRAEFAVSPDGIVEMLDDEPVESASDIPAADEGEFQGSIVA